MEGGAGFDLLRHARDGAVKLVQGVPAEIRNRVLSQAEPIPDDATPGVSPSERKLVYDAILEALTRRQQVRIWYRDHAMVRPG